MGLRCLMGHDFDQPQVEREREVDGEEVLIAVREVKTCRRCGERRTVSESKEITTLSEYHLGPDAVADSAADAGSGIGAETGTGTAAEASTGPDAASAADDAGAGTADPAPDEPPTGDADAVADADPAHAEAGDAVDETVAALREGAPADADAGDASAGDDGDEGDVPAEGEPELDLAAAGVVDPAEEAADGPFGDPDAGADGAGDADADADGAGDADADAITDDGVILDDDADDADDGERARGEWPDASGLAAGREPGGSDDAAEPTDGADAAADAVDAAGATDAAGTTAAEEGGWPEPTGEDEGYDAVPANAEAKTDASANGAADVAVEGLTPHRRAGDASYVGHERAAASDGSFVTADEPGDASDVPASRTEFYCPNCGHAGAAGETSMRPGDVCPACRRGYVDERAT